MTLTDLIDSEMKGEKKRSFAIVNGFMGASSFVYGHNLHPVHILEILFPSGL